MGETAENEHTVPQEQTLMTVALLPQLFETGFASMMNGFHAEVVDVVHRVTSGQIDASTQHDALLVLNCAHGEVLGLALPR